MTGRIRKRKKTGQPETTANISKTLPKKNSVAIVPNLGQRRPNSPGAALRSFTLSCGSWSPCELGARLHAARVRKTVAARRVTSLLVSRCSAYWPPGFDSGSSRSKVTDRLGRTGMMMMCSACLCCRWSFSSSSYSSSSVVRSVARSVPPVLFEAALQAVCMLPRFFQNKTHAF